MYTVGNLVIFFPLVRQDKKNGQYFAVISAEVCV